MDWLEPLADWLDEHSPDGLLKLGLTTIFGPGAIVAAFLLFNFISAWFGITKVGYRTSKRIRREARGAGERTTDYLIRNLGGRVVLTLVLFFLQAAWVSLAYYVGNSISIAVNSASYQQFPTVSGVLSSLRWDMYSEVWLGLSAFTLLSSYFWSLSVTRFLQFLLIVPGMIYGFCGLIGGALNTVTMLTGIDPSMKPAILVYMFTFGVAGTFYVFATLYALSASEWIKRVWSATSLSAHA